MAFATKFRGHSAVDVARLPLASPATKMVASFMAILFSIATFILPNAAGRVITAIVACVFTAAALLRPSSMRMGTWILSLVAAAFTTAAVVCAAMDLMNAFGPVSPNVGP